MSHRCCCRAAHRHIVQARFPENLPFLCYSKHRFHAMGCDGKLYATFLNEKTKSAGSPWL